ncbi:MAG: hypothetical protein R6X19_03830 [Kiritimatiellia bacterium]
MISCTEFIPAYSELFRFLEARCDKPAVTGFWEYISAHFLNNLRDLVAQNGINGCWLYWNRTLNEEAGEFRIIMRHCPSKGRLLEMKHIQPHPDYRGHCDLLCRRVLEPLGYTYEFDSSQVDKAACAIVVRRKKGTT